MHAGVGVHETVLDYLNNHFSKGVNVLVLGAGTGAFDCRLFDNGFTNITSLDINADNYHYDNDAISFVAADLNESFADKVDEKFDVVIAIEIIEHLYSTPHFLSNCHDILNEDGALLISTPNPRSYASRWKFLFTGFHNGFQGVPVLYEHINPIHIDIFRHHCFFQGFTMKHYTSFNHKYPITPIKRALRYVLANLLGLSDRLTKNSHLLKEGKAISFYDLRMSKKGQR